MDQQRKKSNSIFTYLRYKYREVRYGGEFLKRLIWRFMRLFGQRGKRCAWDGQYESGYWRDLSSKDSELIEIIEDFSRGGKIVSLGCGADDIILKLNPHVYSSYLGIDISKVAIEHAIDNAKRLGLTNCQFCVGDIAEWEGDKNITLIILEESIYYLNSGQQQRLLERCYDSLNSNGSVLITVHSRYKHEKTINRCKEISKVVKEINKGEKTYLILKSVHNGKN